MNDLRPTLKKILDSKLIRIIHPLYSKALEADKDTESNKDSLYLLHNLITVLKNEGNITSQEYFKMLEDLVKFNYIPLLLNSELYDKIFNGNKDLVIEEKNDEETDRDRSDFN